MVPTLYLFAQSICINYSCFENMGQFVTLKKNQVQNMDLICFKFQTLKNISSTRIVGADWLGDYVHNLESMRNIKLQF